MDQEQRRPSGLKSELKIKGPHSETQAHSKTEAKPQSILAAIKRAKPSDSQKKQQRIPLRFSSQRG
jgi:hypothetical protein